MTIPHGFVRGALVGETNSLRFESFAIELLGVVEGKTYLPTSRNYDRGRDGRALQMFPDGLDVIACTTSEALDSKILDDAQRLAATTKLASLTYCTSQQVTEHSFDKYETTIRGALPAGTPVRLLGLDQIAALVQQHEELFLRHYRQEVDDIRRLWALGDEGTDIPTTGLRLALLMTEEDDALALREELSARLLLEELQNGQSRSLATLAAGISARLRLPAAISTAFVSQVAGRLQEQEKISVDTAGQYRITPKGTAALVSGPEEAARELRHGREALRSALGELLGGPMPADNFDRLWPVFRDGMAELFHVHGTSIIEMVAALHGDAEISDDIAFKAARERLADRCAAAFPNAQQQEEIRTAVVDLFSRKGSEAFAWLSSVCSVFVMLASLGLEPQSANEISRTLRGLLLLPDTDVFLSLLCDREDNHKEVSDVVKAWRTLGGNIGATLPVLEEAARHAWIAERDYLGVYDIIGNLSDERASYLINNAFVRTFRLVARTPTNRKLWDRYIRGFRGTREYDYSAIASHLREDYGVEILAGAVSEADAVAQPLFGQARRSLLVQAAQDFETSTDELDPITEDKVKRDAILLVTLQLLRRRFSETGPYRSAIIVSSARPLRRAAAEFSNELGAPEPVLTLPAVAALLALTPGVQVGLGSLRELLFDARLAKKLRPAELFLYRLLESTQYQLPLAKRGFAARQLRTSLLEQAKRRGRSFATEERALLRIEEPPMAASILRETLHALAMTPDVASLLEAKDRRIRDLEREVSRMEAQG